MPVRVAYHRLSAHAKAQTLGITQGWMMASCGVAAFDLAAWELEFTGFSRHRFRRSAQVLNWVHISDVWKGDGICLVLSEG